MYQTICAMYTGMKSVIDLNGHLTESFMIQSGIRRGDNLSPTIFNLYLNDLIKDINNLGLCVSYGDSNISMLAYADDLILISDSEADLKSMLNCLNEYCNKWRLTVNSSKTQIMHCRKVTQPTTEFEFKYGNANITKTDTYRYLGVTINYNTDIGKLVETLANASSRALGSITSKYYKTFKAMFDAVVYPVMSYVAAAWGYTRYTKCDTVQNRAMRTFLGVSKITPIAAMYGDLNWTPPIVKHKVEVVKFWLRACEMPEQRLTKKIFMHDQELASRGRISFCHEVKLILEAANIDLDSQTENTTINDVLQPVYKSEMNTFHNHLKTEINTMSRLELYRELKHDFKTEKYVEVMRDRKQRSLVAKARMGTLPIEIETGRYRGTPRNERLCKQCDCRVVEDISHFMLHCSKYDELRIEMYEQILVNTNGANMSDEELRTILFASNEPQIMFATAKFIHKALIKRSRAS